MDIKSNEKVDFAVNLPEQEDRKFKYLETKAENCT